MVFEINKYAVLNCINNPKAKYSQRRITDENGTLTGGITRMPNGTYMDKQSHRNGGFGYNVYEIEFINVSANLAKKLVKMGNERKELYYSELDPVKY